MKSCGRIPHDEVPNGMKSAKADEVETSFRLIKSIAKGDFILKEDFICVADLFPS